MNKKNDKLTDRIKEITERQDKKLLPDFPKKNLLIEVSNICNSSCIFCANRKMTRTRGKINEELLKNILIDAYDLGVREVGFYTTGEPLVNTNLNLYIKIAKEIGYNYIYITTNGILAQIDIMKELISAGLDSVKFSINAINQNDYKFIHGNSLYDLVMNNLKDLYNWRKISQNQFKIYVSYIATKYTEYSNEEIRNNFLNYCDDVMIVNVRNQSGLVPENTELLSCNITDDKIKAERNLPCHYPFNTICVTYEGYLTACCTDFQNYLAYANLNEENLKEAWHNKTITDLRKKHIDKKIEGSLCDNCINNCLNLPTPLRQDLATEISSSFFEDKTLVLNRIKQFKK